MLGRRRKKPQAQKYRCPLGTEKRPGSLPSEPPDDVFGAASLILTSDLRRSERTHSCWFKPPSVRSLVTPAPGTPPRALRFTLVESDFCHFATR